MLSLNLMILRTSLKMDRPQFAKEIGVSLKTLYRWESGQRTPSLKHLKVIIDKYEIEDVYRFMYGKRHIKEIPKLNWI